jgi:hypothetical protein
MALNPRLWRPIAAVLSVANFVGAGIHIGLDQPGNAVMHTLLAAGAAFWTWRLGRPQAPALGNPDTEERMEQLEGELMQQRQELADAQERLDFAERLLAQNAERKRTLPE